MLASLVDRVICFAGRFYSLHLRAPPDITPCNTYLTRSTYYAYDTSNARP